jgi:hypothetical protein
MRLTAFHTPDGIYCWNCLLMGAKPSSAVQQSAYLEALDDYIDYYEDGTLRKCLLDEHGNQLRDAEGNLKTLRHKFAVYCDAICAGATLWRSCMSCLRHSYAAVKGRASKSKRARRSSAWIGSPSTITPFPVEGHNQKTPIFVPSGTCLLSLMSHRCELF